MKSYDLRNNPLFLRNDFIGSGKWGIPLVKREDIDLTDISLISYNDTRSKENASNKNRGVHFFVDDKRFNGIYNRPQLTLEKLRQYKFLLTPDYSVYPEMPLWRQIENAAKNRWMGAYWQNNGLMVVPTISWGLAQSYDFCFDGVESKNIVAVGTIGCKMSRLSFLRGYDYMLQKIEPEHIICFGTPFKEMEGNITEVDYLSSRRRVS